MGLKSGPQKTATLPGKSRGARAHPRGGDDGWYSGYGTPSSSSYDNWTYVAPSEQNPSDTNPTTDPNARTRGVGCRTQTYKVPSADDGGERAVNVVRC